MIEGDSMTRSPNVLLIMVDELAPQALPAYGHPVVRAPYLDRLARDSVVFDAAYTNSPLCAPARASMLAGRLTPGIGAWDNGARGGVSAVKPSRKGGCWI